MDFLAKDEDTLRKIDSIYPFQENVRVNRSYPNQSAIGRTTREDLGVQSYEACIRYQNIRHGRESLDLWLLGQTGFERGTSSV